MRIFLLVPAITLVLSIPVVAQQKDQNEQPTSNPESVEPADSNMRLLLDELIDELGSPRFAIRLQAARKLKAAGEKGIETLRRVTRTGTKETASQALKILQEHMENTNNNALQRAAQKALEAIASDEKNPNSSVAKGILNQQADAKSTPNKQFRQFPMIPPANLRPPVRVQVQNKNGKVTIQVEKNGQKTSITEDKDGIKVEKKDANGKSSKNTYKDLDEMKQKDKEAHQLFQQYKKIGGGIRIQFNGNGIPLKLNARPRNVPNLKPGIPKDGAPKDVEDMQRQMLKRHRATMELHLNEMQKNIENNIPKEHRKHFEDQLNKQIEIMNRPLLELEQKLKQLTPPKGEPGAQPETPSLKGKESAGEKPLDEKALEPELIET